MNKQDQFLLSRRKFVKGLATAGVILPLASAFSPLAWAYDALQDGAELSGTNFDLVIAPMQVNFSGKERTATTVNGLLPGPVLRIKEGDTVTIRVTNKLHEMTSIH
ncbi:MAG: multicopper oxidase domain-containing protein, partial [Mariprofundus sp.]|nr:multicopper oxidase domain-containing protein [Mariprofundus sp.]